MVRTGELLAIKRMDWLGNTVGPVEIDNLNHQFFYMLIGGDEARLMFVLRWNGSRLHTVYMDANPFTQYPQPHM